MDYAALKSELQNDPAGIGYGTLVEWDPTHHPNQLISQTNSDVQLAALINAPGAGTISQGVVSKDVFLTALASPLAALMARADTDSVKQQFAGWLQLLGLATNIYTADADLVATMASAVTAGVFTQAQSDGALKRSGSRAEMLFGPGSVLASDIAIALGRS
ncbi:MAG TPA: hypothetical protein VKU00_18375 [Chthonomonadaceae bacterium]|nr:hypothetical protein [Chthonomonadaceae bacterium]